MGPLITCILVRLNRLLSDLALECRLKAAGRKTLRMLIINIRNVSIVLLPLHWVVVGGAKPVAKSPMTAAMASWSSVHSTLCPRL